MKCERCGEKTNMTVRTGSNKLLNCCTACYDKAWEKRVGEEGQELPPLRPVYVAYIGKENVDENIFP